MLAGTRRVLETAHKLIGNTWGDEGSTRLQHTWTADPDLIRRLRSGRPATSATAPPPSSTSPGPGPPRSPCCLLTCPPSRPGSPRPAASLPPTPLAPLMTCSDPEPPRDTRSTRSACPLTRT